MLSRADRLLRKAIRTRYLVTLITDDAFEGVLYDADREHLVLADAAELAPSGVRTAADGHVWIPRASVKYMQQAVATRGERT